MSEVITRLERAENDLSQFRRAAAINRPPIAVDLLRSIQGLSSVEYAQLGMTPEEYSTVRKFATGSS